MFLFVSGVHANVLPQELTIEVLDLNVDSDRELFLICLFNFGCFHI